MDGNALRIFLASIIELFAIGVATLNIFSIVLVLHSKFVKKAAACIFISTLLANEIVSLIFAIVIVPTLVVNKYFYHESIYFMIDCIGISQWILGALLSLTMALERLAVLVFPKYSNFILKSLPMLMIIFAETMLSVSSWWFFCYDSENIQ